MPNEWTLINAWDFVGIGLGILEFKKRLEMGPLPSLISRKCQPPASASSRVSLPIALIVFDMVMNVVVFQLIILT